MKTIKLKCVYCGKDCIRTRRKHKYYYSNKGARTDIIYECKDCEAHVGIHTAGRKKGQPLGNVAIPLLRRKRARTHKTFDKIWKKGYMTKSQAYSWAANKINIPILDFHISMLSFRQCDQVQHHAMDYLREMYILQLKYVNKSVDK